MNNSLNMRFIGSGAANLANGEREEKSNYGYKSNYVQFNLDFFCIRRQKEQETFLYNTHFTNIERSMAFPQLIVSFSVPSSYRFDDARYLNIKTEKLFGKSYQ
jgi:hypothetical protein